MKTISLFDMSQTTLTETPDNAHFSGSSIEQDVTIRENTLMMYSPDGGYFYAIKLPNDLYLPNDQFVGIFNG